MYDFNKISMKKFFSIILFAFAAFVAANAIIVQKVILKDGSEYNGYIQSQDGYGKLTFRSYQAIVNLNNDNGAASITEVNYNVKSLDDLWQKWANENEAIVNSGDSQMLTLCNISYKGKNISKVRVLERGAIIKYLDFSPNTYSMSWKDIKLIVGEKRPKTSLSGINRIYQLKDGQTFEGQYAEQTDSTVSVFLKSGVVQTFSNKDVIKCSMVGVNPNQNIFEQSELLDIVKTANSEIKGIIIEQDFSGKTDKDKYFLIKQENSAISSVKLSDIVELSKTENPKFAPKIDALLKDGELMVNRKLAKLSTVKGTNDFFVVDSVQNKAIFLKLSSNGSVKISIEYKTSNIVAVETYKLVKMAKNVSKKNIVTYGFTYKDLVDNVYSPKLIETSINHTTKVDYVLDKRGEYAFYDSKNKLVVPVIIK